MGRLQLNVRDRKYSGEKFENRECFGRHLCGCAKYRDRRMHESDEKSDE